MPLARLSVADVERWHIRLRRAGMADAGIRNQHGVLRAALSLAVRWGWVATNVAAMARLRSTKVQQRTVMSVDDVRAVMAAAATIDPAAELALRIAAIAGARRAELASLRWTDEQGGTLLIDSAIEITKRGERRPQLREAATNTANVRTVTQAFRDRQELASPRPATLVRNRCDRSRTRRADRGWATRSLEPRHDLACVRPRIRGGGPSRRSWARSVPGRFSNAPMLNPDRRSARCSSARLLGSTRLVRRTAGGRAASPDRPRRLRGHLPSRRRDGRDVDARARLACVSGRRP